MAEVTVNRFRITQFPAGSITVWVNFSLNLTPTEERLQIPFYVKLRLMERDGPNYDNRHVYANGLLTRRVNDDVASPFNNFGPFLTTTRTYSWEVDRDDLPGEVGNEEYYVLAMAIPDIQADVSFSDRSDEEVADLATP